MLNAASIKSIQNVMRKDVGIHGESQQVEQLAWMLFLKAVDWRKSAALGRKKRNYQILNGLHWQEWAVNNVRTDDALLRFLNDQLFPKVKNTGPEFLRMTLAGAQQC